MHGWIQGRIKVLLKQATSLPPLKSARGLKVSCPEEIAYRKGFIDAEQVKVLAEPLKKNAYGQYLLKMIKGY